MVEARGNLGATLVRLGKIDEGIAALELAAAGDEKGAYDVLLSLGVAYRQKGLPDKAVSALQRAVVLKPNEPQGWTNLGVAKARTADKEGAIAAYKKAVELAPENGEFWFNLGSAHRRMQQTDEAILAYEKAVSLNPNVAGAYYDLGILYSQERETQKALAAFKRYLQVSGKGVPAKERQDVEDRIKSLEGSFKK